MGGRLKMQCRCGFSRIEIITVLAIIATMLIIAVPSSIVGEAPAPTLSGTQRLKMVRTAIDLYRKDHDGEIPGLECDLAKCLKPYFPNNDVYPTKDWVCGGTVEYVRGERSLNRVEHSEHYWRYDLDSGQIELSGPNQDHEADQGWSLWRP